MCASVPDYIHCVAKEEAGKRVSLTAPSMMRTISHLNVQMQMREGGQRRGTWDRVHTGHKKMARKPVSNS